MPDGLEELMQSTPVGKCEAENADSDGPTFCTTLSPSKTMPGLSLSPDSSYQRRCILTTIVQLAGRDCQRPPEPTLGRSSENRDGPLLVLVPLASVAICG
jgi:hypothetical protein